MKKFCYLLLFFVAIVILLLPSVFAAGTTVAVSDTTAQPGDEVVLHVNITGNVGFGTGKYSLHYDPTILNLVQLDVTGTLLANGAVLNHEKGIISFSNINGVTQDGVLFNVKFMVAENAVDGDYEVSVTIKDVVNAETLIPVAIDTTPGKITVKAPHRCSGTYVGQTDATCTTPGVKAHYACECGKIYSDEACTIAVTSASLGIKAAGHRYGTWTETKAATCKAKGERQHSCTVCGHVEKGSVSAKGHCYGEWKETTAPTCTEKGEETRVCAQCDKTEKRAVSAKGHTYGQWTETRAPSCTEKGLDSRACACGEAETKEGREATGHSMSEWSQTKEPTCTEKGEETRICSCGESETREIDVVEHEWHWAIDCEPTSKKEGLKHEACRHCNAIRSENTVMEKLDGNGSSLWLLWLLLLLVLGVLAVAGYFLYRHKKIHK